MRQPRLIGVKCLPFVTAGTRLYTTPWYRRGCYVHTRSGGHVVPRWGERSSTRGLPAPGAAHYPRGGMVDGVARQGHGGGTFRFRYMFRYTVVASGYLEALFCWAKGARFDSCLRHHPAVPIRLSLYSESPEKPAKCGLSCFYLSRSISRHIPILGIR